MYQALLTAGEHRSAWFPLDVVRLRKQSLRSLLKRGLIGNSSGDFGPWRKHYASALPELLRTGSKLLPGACKNFRIEPGSSNLLLIGLCSAIKN